VRDNDTDVKMTQQQKQGQEEQSRASGTDEPGGNSKTERATDRASAAGAATGAPVGSKKIDLGGDGDCGWRAIAYLAA